MHKIDIIIIHKFLTKSKEFNIVAVQYIILKILLQDINLNKYKSKQIKLSLTFLSLNKKIESLDNFKIFDI